MRLIDADELKKLLRKEYKDCIKDDGEGQLIAMGIDTALDFVKNSPTIDAKPVVHAKCETSEDPDCEFYICSNCNYDFFFVEGTPKDNEVNFCPRCGAKMED